MVSECVESERPQEGGSVKWLKTLSHMRTGTIIGFDNVIRGFAKSGSVSCLGQNLSWSGLEVTTWLGC